MLTDSDVASKNPLYSKLAKYLKDDAKLLDELDSAFALKADPLRITTCGLLKAGKSSLLNALTDHLDPENELFATGAVRTTVKNQTFSEHDFHFIDTPGLDAKDEDDEEAWKGIKSADVLLFIHNSQTGELHKSEVDFLKEVSGGAGAAALKGRVVVVLTHCETYEEDVIHALGDKIRDQVKNAIGHDIRQFHISFTSYRKGMLENKHRLAEWSGVPELRKYLFSNLAEMHDAARGFRNDRVLSIREKILDALGAEISHREKRLEALRSEENNKRDAYSKDAKRLIEVLRKKIADYDRSYS